MKAYAAEGDAAATAPTGTEATTAQDGAATAKPSAPGFFDSPMMLIGLAALWIWFLLRNKKNKKKQKAEKEKLNQLSKGDKIVTIGRIHGVVVKTTETTFTIKPDKKSDFTLTFDREAMMRHEKEKDAPEADKPEKAEGVAKEIK